MCTLSMIARSSSPSLLFVLFKHQIPLRRDRSSPLSFSVEPRLVAMEGQAGTLTLTKSIRVNGVPAEASLAADGTLRWRAGDGDERCLAVESEMLGFQTEGQRITLRAFVGSYRGPSCGGGSFGKRTRRDYVLEMPTEEAALQWSQRLRDCIESLGKMQGLFVSSFCPGS